MTTQTVLDAAPLPTAPLHQREHLDPAPLTGQTVRAASTLPLDFVPVSAFAQAVRRGAATDLPVRQEGDGLQIVALNAAQLAQHGPDAVAGSIAGALEGSTALSIGMDANLDALQGQLDALAARLGGAAVPVFLKPDTDLLSRPRELRRALELVERLNSTDPLARFGIELEAGDLSHLRLAQTVEKFPHLPLVLSGAGQSTYSNLPASRNLAAAMRLAPDDLEKIITSSDHPRSFDDIRGIYAATSAEPARFLGLQSLTVEAPRTRELGATHYKDGVNFALESVRAASVELCLFASQYDRFEAVRIPLTKGDKGVWAGFVPGLTEGQVYGYRVNGEFNPAANLHFNSDLVLSDPYADALCRDTRKWNPVAFGLHEQRQGHHAPVSYDTSAVAPLSVVVDHSRFDWQGVPRPNIEPAQMVIAELNVRSATMLRDDVPPEQRGTYAGLAHPNVIADVKKVANAIELLPVSAGLAEARLSENGLANLWNYNPAAYFAPEPFYAAALTPLEQVDEFKTMVREYHRAGIKVGVDVVFNHTAEGISFGLHAGPTLNLRAIDGRYYLTDHRGNCIDFTGCGNTVDVNFPPAARLVHDCLKHWQKEFQIDFFRFDEAPVLGVRPDGDRSRAPDGHTFDRYHPLFQALRDDSELSKCVLIAEAWSCGPRNHSYQLGQFMDNWSEWNGKFRDEVRDYWRGGGNGVRNIAMRLFGSSDVFQWSGRDAKASINFVTAHDGFTLADQWSYDRKHNHANLEDNRDGIDNNVSWNCGAEGPTNDPAVIETRTRLARASMATLYLSRGIPMVCLGDTVLHSQRGNNNAYCQDNPISWIDWNAGPHASEFQELCEGLMKLRQSEPVFQRTSYTAQPLPGGRKEVHWLHAAGREFETSDWLFDGQKCLGMLLSKETLPLEQRAGAHSMLVITNSSPNDFPFYLPKNLPGFEKGRWEMVCDTAASAPFEPEQGGRKKIDGDKIHLHGRSVNVLRFIEE